MLMVIIMEVKMAKKRRHSKVAADEAGRAGFRCGSIIVPDLGKARHIVGCSKPY